MMFLHATKQPCVHLCNKGHHGVGGGGGGEGTNHFLIGFDASSMGGISGLGTNRGKGGFLL